MTTLKQITQQLLFQEQTIRDGNGKEGEERQRRLGRLTARERIHHLIDDPASFFELGIWAGYEMYPNVGPLPAAGVITGIGSVKKHSCMIIANDATVKAGAFFPQSVKKVLRAQRIAYECRLPILYLVDSSGVYLPMQDEIFPDEDDFGRIFRNNAIISAAGIPQFAAIMGNCIAGGGYLPVLCDQLLMTEGSGLYLAGPALVKAAIGQLVETEELGGAKMHASISGTVDFYEKDDLSCLKQMRKLVNMLPNNLEATPITPPKIQNNADEIYELINIENKKPYDTYALLNLLVDEGSFLEYKALYGPAIITAFASIQGIDIGIVANQRKPTTAKGEMEVGGVIYSESADKAARFIMNCNQMHLPLVFLQDVVGFMVGKQAEQSGIIRSGAKLVSALSNSIVPKITIIIGNSFGAGNYALCGKAYDPNFILAWPNAKYAVMGADQAAETLLNVQKKAAEREGKVFDVSILDQEYQEIKARYERQMDIRYAAARGWVDAIIPPDSTRDTLGKLLQLVKRAPQKSSNSFHTGVIQV